MSRSCDRLQHPRSAGSRGPRNCCAMLAVLLTAGCAVWRPLPGAGFARAASERLGHVRVSLRDGTELDLEDASVSTDSIVGYGGQTRARYAVARDAVTSVEGRETEGASTFAVGALVPVVAAFLAVATFVALAAASGGLD